MNKKDSRTFTIDDFIKKSNLKHNNKYDYSKTFYINSKLKVKIICKEHGEFEQNANNHIRGNGCPSCKKVKRINTDEFIIKSKIIHNDKFDYTLSTYVNQESKVKIICPVHGLFEQEAGSH